MEKDTGSTLRYFGLDEKAEFLASGDFIVTLAPLVIKDKDPSLITGNFLNRTVFRFLRKSAVIINAGRGGLIDQDDLLEFMDSPEGQRVRLYADVMLYEDDPKNPKRVAFLKHKRIWSTGHSASAVLGPRVAMVMTAIKNLWLLLRGLPPTDPVNIPSNPRYVTRAA